MPLSLCERKDSAAPGRLHPPALLIDRRGHVHDDYSIIDFVAD